MNFSFRIIQYFDIVYAECFLLKYKNNLLRELTFQRKLSFNFDV